MEYRGKQYRPFRALTRNGSGRWDFDGRTASGHAPNRKAAVKEAERAIDQALAPKKKRLIRSTK
jgi:hypothetical protein